MRRMSAAFLAMTVTVVSGAAPPQKLPIAPGQSISFKETPSLASAVTARSLPAVQQRVPTDPLVVDLNAVGRKPGNSGGVLRTMMSKEKDVRLLNTWGYARLVAWTPQLQLKPDLLKSIDVKDGRVFIYDNDLSRDEVNAKRRLAWVPDDPGVCLRPVTNEFISPR